MKRFITSFTFVLLFSVASFFSPLTAFASTYGSGAYGDCLYGTGCTASTPTPTPMPISAVISSTVSSVENTITTFFCTDQPPSSAPNLFQIDVTSTTAHLYFAPAGGPYDRHFVSFGQGNDNEGYGAEFSTSNSTGALTYLVKQLKPSTAYTFKVRGGNGCKPGAWSQTLTIKTQGARIKKLAKFYPNHQYKYVVAKPQSFFSRAAAAIKNIFH